MNNADRRVKRGWMNLKVTKVIEETSDTKTFIMEDLEEAGRTWDYWPGQYLTFRFDGLTEKPIVRSYTMSSSPNQMDNCAVTVKRIEKGVVSNWLCDEVKVGSVLRARGPIGRFIYESAKDKSHLVMVAAGSGVTPFVSIMREYAAKLGQPGAPEKITLLISYRSQNDLILWQDLQKISSYKNARVYTTLSRDQSAPAEFWQGRIDDDKIAKAVGGHYAECTFMSCGPQAIMDLTKQHALQHGVSESQIKTESFDG